MVPASPPLPPPHSVRCWGSGLCQHITEPGPKFVLMVRTFQYNVDTPYPVLHSKNMFYIRDWAGPGAQPNVCFPHTNYIRSGRCCWWQCLLHYNDIVLAVTIGFYYSEELGGTQEVIHEARKIEFAFSIQSSARAVQPLLRKTWNLRI